MISAGRFKSHSSGWLFCILAALLLSLTACGGEQAPVKLYGQTMGTTWQVSYLPEPAAPPPTHLQGEIEAVLEAVNRSMSTYRPDSEISRFNQAPSGTWFAVSTDFMTVLQAALRIGQASGGSYDVTVGELVNLWGFGPDRGEDAVPAALQIEALLARLGQDKLQLDVDGLKVLKTQPLALDFSSIAKGFAVDKVADLVARQPIANFLVEVGGEMRLAGVSGRGDPWRIAIEQPDMQAAGVARGISISDQAVATSGDYRNFFEVQGVRYSHSLDPRNGFPVKHDLVSVTVIHPRAMDADAWATALTVLGAEQAMVVAKAQGLAVYFIRREGQGFASSNSPAFAPYLQ